MAWFDTQKRLKDVEQRLFNVENLLIQYKSRLESQELLNDDMRNKVLRKIQQPKKQQLQDLSGLLPGQTTKIEGEDDGINIQK